MQRMLKPDKQSELPQRAHACRPWLFLLSFSFILFYFLKRWLAIVSVNG
jgi:hypothetical protein